MHTPRCSMKHRCLPLSGTMMPELVCIWFIDGGEEDGHCIPKRHGVSPGRRKWWSLFGLGILCRSELLVWKPCGKTGRTVEGKYHERMNRKTWVKPFRRKSSVPLEARKAAPAHHHPIPSDGALIELAVSALVGVHNRLHPRALSHFRLCIAHLSVLRRPVSFVVPCSSLAPIRLC
jgi:hypothetical protein